MIRRAPYHRPRCSKHSNGRRAATPHHRAVARRQVGIFEYMPEKWGDTTKPFGAAPPKPELIARQTGYHRRRRRCRRQQERGFSSRLARPPGLTARRWCWGRPSGN